MQNLFANMRSGVSFDYGYNKPRGIVWLCLTLIASNFLNIWIQAMLDSIFDFYIGLFVFLKGPKISQEQFWDLLDMF